MSKPEFDPNKPFEAADNQASKPAFDPSQPFETSNPVQNEGNLDTAIHGLATGLTFGANKHITAGTEAAGDVIQGKSPLEDLYNRYKQHLADQVAAEEQAKEEHPIAAYGSEVAGALGSPIMGALKGAGVIGEVAKDAGTGAKILNAARTGGALAGTQAIIGGNKPIPEEDLGDIVKQTTGGAVLGGALGSLGAGVDSLAQSAAAKDIPFISDAAKRYSYGRAGTNLFDAKKLANDVYENVSQLGDEGIAAQVKSLSNSINDTFKAATEGGKEIDYSGLMTHVQNLKQQASESENPLVKEQLGHLTSYLEDRLLGPLEMKSIQTIEKTGEKVVRPAVESTPSTEEALQSKVDELNANESRNAKATGTVPKKYSVQEQDGKLNIIEESPIENDTGMRVSEGVKNSKEAAEEALRKQAFKAEQSGTPISQNLQEGTGENEGLFHHATSEVPENSGQNYTKRPFLKEWQTPQEFQPGTPEQVESQYDYTTTKFPQRAKEVPTLPADDAKEVEQYLGKLRADGRENTPEYNAALKKADELTTEGVNLGTKSDISPGGYEPLRERWNLFKEGMGHLGMDNISPSDMYTKDLQGNDVINPDFAGKLTRMFEKAQNDPAAAQNLELGLGKLDKAGFKGLPELRAKAAEALEKERLGVSPPKLSSALSPIGGPQYKIAKNIAAIPNAIGLGANKVGNAIQKVAPITSAPAKLGQVVSDVIEPKASAANKPEEDFLGNKIDTAKKTPENFSRALYTANPQQLQQVVQTLKNSQYGSYADSLGEALKVGDQPRINSILYVIASNPNTRELLMGAPKKAGYQSPGVNAKSTMGNSGY